MKDLIKKLDKIISLLEYKQEFLEIIVEAQDMYTKIEETTKDSEWILCKTAFPLDGKVVLTFVREKINLIEE